MQFSAIIFGGIGEDVWDREIIISAADFKDAFGQAVAQAETEHGEVSYLAQSDGRDLGQKFEAFARHVLENQHVSDRLKQSRLGCYDHLIKLQHSPDKAFNAANQILHIQTK